MKKLVLAFIALLLLAGCAGIDAELDKANGIVPLQAGRMVFNSQLEIAFEVYQAVDGPQYGCLLKLTLKNNTAQPIMPTVLVVALQNKKPISETKAYFTTTKPKGQSYATEIIGLPFSASCSNIELKARLQDELKDIQ